MYIYMHIHSIQLYKFIPGLREALITGGHITTALVKVHCVLTNEQ